MSKICFTNKETDGHYNNSFLKQSSSPQSAPKEIIKEQCSRTLSMHQNNPFLFYNVVMDCQKDIRKNFYLTDEKTIQQAMTVLDTVFYDSKNQPCLILLNALKNYVDWLYLHAIHVALISVILAIELNYKRDSLGTLCLGALLHDIGKLLIPENILQKKGKLSSREMLQIRQHCQLGYILIKDYQTDEICEDIIIQHHECLDGSGYPYGLTEEHLSDEVKIVTIADVVDVITSDRPYKKIYPLNTAVQKLNDAGEKYSGLVLKTLEKYIL